jgi:hypothetical protein
LAGDVGVGSVQARNTNAALYATADDQDLDRRGSRYRLPGALRVDMAPFSGGRSMLAQRTTAADLRKPLLAEWAPRS